jgi:hypothetical protein
MPQKTFPTGFASKHPTTNCGGVTMNRWVALILFFLLPMPVLGSGKKWTQAESLGFAGPIKTASTTCQTFMQQPAHPDGPVIFYPVFCGEYEFDKDGNQVKSGWIKDGNFTGTVEHKTLDGLGRVQEETSGNEKGEEISRHVYTNGPAGRVQDDSYVNGKLFNTTIFTYDSQGNVIESNSSKPDGTLVSHYWNRFDERGNLLEEVSEGPGDFYSDVVETYNPKSGQLESTTSLNRDGSVRLWSRVNDTTVLSFWQQPGDKRTYGSDICFTDDNGTEENCREYNWDGTYATIHYTFTDKARSNPLKVILYGTDHQVVLAVEYEYEMDAFRNWTKRTVWVQTAESGQRQLLEKDARTLTYYPGEAVRP